MAGNVSNVSATNTVSGASGAGRNSLNNLLQTVSTLNTLLGGNSGKTKTTTTSTEERKVSPEAMQSIVNNLQAQANGLASVLQPQRAAGLYNSSTNQQLAQQFITNNAAKAAELSIPRTNTTSVVQQAPQASGLSKGLAGLTAAAQAYAMGQKLIGSDVGKKLMGIGAGTTLGGGALANVYRGNLDSDIGDLTRYTDWNSNVEGAPDFISAEGFGDVGIDLSSLSAASPAIAAGGASMGDMTALAGDWSIADTIGSAFAEGGSFLGDIGSSVSSGVNYVFDEIASWF